MTGLPVATDQAIIKKLKVICQKSYFLVQRGVLCFFGFSTLCLIGLVDFCWDILFLEGLFLMNLEEKITDRKTMLGPYRTNSKLAAKKETLWDRFKEWKRVRRLRTCNGCLKQFDKTEVNYEMPMFLSIPKEGFKGSIHPGDFAFPTTYAFCSSCKAENYKKYKQEIHEEKVRKKAYELQIEKEAYEKVKRKFAALNEEKYTKV